MSSSSGGIIRFLLFVAVVALGATGYYAYGQNTKLDAYRKANAVLTEERDTLAVKNSELTSAAKAPMCSRPTLRITGMSALTGQATRRSARPSASSAAVPTTLRAATAQTGVMYCSSSLLTTQVKPQASTTTTSRDRALRRDRISAGMADVANGKRTAPTIEVRLAPALEPRHVYCLEPRAAARGLRASQRAKAAACGSSGAGA